MTTDSTYHTSVLLHESIDALSIVPNGVYVDVTYGGGGHSKLILEKLGVDGRLFAFDQDEDAFRNKVEDNRLQLIRSNFSEMQNYLRIYGILAVDGILADLGVSSWQFDTPNRGFSYRYENGPLDMRMNTEVAITAADVLNTYDALHLQELLSTYGEVRNAKTLALAIVAARNVKPFSDISDLLLVCEANRTGDWHRYMAQVFQALRIEVNNELGVLKTFLQRSTNLLKPGGRLAVITFHSLEDRLVKNYMKHGTFEDEPVKDLFGNFYAPFKPVNKKPIEATKEEQKRNTRSRSAKLRVAERKI